MPLAVAVDLGASSGRVALGELVAGRITFKVVEQQAHGAVESDDVLRWDIEKLLGLCEIARKLAVSCGAPSIGIDSWGVDHGFLDAQGKLLAAPVCYRDESHARSFDALAAHRSRLFELTGCQHQPFNTIYQLHARLAANPDFLSLAADWLMLSDLLGYLLSGEKNMEATQASTTQLVGLDGKWCHEAFDLIGWPTPNRMPTLPGTLGGEVAPGVRIAHVGSHDTASAVCGFGSLGPTDLFLNIGTWTLVGAIIDAPDVSAGAREGNFSNERCVDGRVRFLRNIPGFYVLSRVHEELGIESSIPEWIESAAPWHDVANLMDPAYFNPESMLQMLSSTCRTKPSNRAEWAGLALNSVVAAIAEQPASTGAVLNRRFRRIRLGGGGSQSSQICQAIATATGLEVVAGPAEVTVLGNLAVQFVAQGALSWEDMPAVLDASAETVRYTP